MCCNFTAFCAEICVASDASHGDRPVLDMRKRVPYKMDGHSTWLYSADLRH